MVLTLETFGGDKEGAADPCSDKSAGLYDIGFFWGLRTDAALPLLKSFDGLRR